MPFALDVSLPAPAHAYAVVFQLIEMPITIIASLSVTLLPIRRYAISLSCRQLMPPARVISTAAIFD